MICYLIGWKIFVETNYCWKWTTNLNILSNDEQPKMWFVTRSDCFFVSLVVKSGSDRIKAFISNCFPFIFCSKINLARTVFKYLNKWLLNLIEWQMFWISRSEANPVNYSSSSASMFASQTDNKPTTNPQGRCIPDLRTKPGSSSESNFVPKNKPHHLPRQLQPQEKNQMSGKRWAGMKKTNSQWWQLKTMVCQEQQEKEETSQKQNQKLQRTKQEARLPP